MSSLLAAPTATILMPGDPGWDDARRAWNLAVDQHPAAIALPESAHDVAAAIGFARERGLRVAAQGTGHNARPQRSSKMPGRPVPATARRGRQCGHRLPPDPDLT
jgi:FAD/FMN-containing dehydrogenase